MLARRALGHTTLTLPQYAFGASALGTLGLDEAVATVNAAIAAGMDHFDTAPFYGLGESERRLGAALAQAQGPFTISTKVGRLIRTGNDGRAQPVFDYSRDGAARSLEESLTRLGRERVDMAVLHDVSRRFHGERTNAVFDVSLAGAYRTLDAWRRDGTVKAIGLGVNDCATCLRALREADFDFLILAGRLTLLDQEGFAEVLPEAARRGVGVIAAAPFNSGILATGANAEATYFYESAPAEILERTRRIEAVCARHAVPLPAAALQFALRHPAVSCVLAGYRSVDQVQQNLAHAAHSITEEFWADLSDSKLLSARMALPAV
ncbi:MAG: aldo/keto reductase [Burkholderiales bacterium]|nr:aldo/keto reductase [Burkholderiales bacterium]